jgi:hypothetical protein
VHFRVLLTDADYDYQLVGTGCPRLTPTHGSGGGANDVRGRIWSERLSAVQGQAWCPGTYRVSVTIIDRGRYGNLTHRAKPLRRPRLPGAAALEARLVGAAFGSATFTVTR